MILQKAGSNKDIDLIGKYGAISKSGWVAPATFCAHTYRDYGCIIHSDYGHNTHTD